MVDNRWVISYNPWLILRYDCHINVEICNSIKSVKYLYKYILKGPDRVSMEVQGNSRDDEIQQFVDVRWVCAPEAMWKIFAFLLTKMCPAVERLQIHLEENQMMTFDRNQTISNILNNEDRRRTMLEAFFAKNNDNMDVDSRRYLYREFPLHYRWISRDQIWQRRESNQRVIGCIYTVSPSEGERFYLRVLLNHVRGPRSFQHLRTVNGITYSTFKEAAEKLGLLRNDDCIRQCLREASSMRMPISLRRLFATILAYCEPTGIRALWSEFLPCMMEDYPSTSNTNIAFITNMLLRDLNSLLAPLGKAVSDFDLPTIRHELDTTVIPEDDVNCVQKLNADQLTVYIKIMDAINNKRSKLFFIDGLGGIGKTFLYRALVGTIRSRGEIALPAATLGIAATNLHLGRTAHSAFKLPLQPDASSTCSISKQFDLAALLRLTSLIIWDETTTIHRYAFEAFDRTLRDITDVDLPFGGKIIVTGGDFRQVLPVVTKGTSAQIMNASLRRSPLWNQVHVLHLTQNMRSINDPNYADFLLRIGDEIEPTIENDMIRLPDSMVQPISIMDPLQELIKQCLSKSRTPCS